jgi:hypothetical protein
MQDVVAFRQIPTPQHVLGSNDRYTDFDFEIEFRFHSKRNWCGMNINESGNWRYVTKIDPIRKVCFCRMNGSYTSNSNETHVVRRQ